MTTCVTTSGERRSREPRERGRNPSSFFPLICIIIYIVARGSEDKRTTARGLGAAEPVNILFLKACSGIPAPGIPPYWSVLTRNINTSLHWSFMSITKDGELASSKLATGDLVPTS